MTNAILTHDAGVSAFADAGGAASTDGDGVSFNWDEDNIVTVDAPADLQGAFDTDRFYKVEGATIARPIKQPYLVGDELDIYKKPADALKRAAWSFDNAPFTLGHPDSGMVKNVDDIHGFWRNPRYDEDDDRLKEDLYIPVTDDEALEFVEDNSDVSVGFYNRVTEQFSGDTGDLTDDDVDGYQVHIYGDHIAGVEQGRCSGEDGCGLDDADHGAVVDGEAETHESTDYQIAPPTADYTEDGTYYAIAPDETDGDEPKYPINSCSDVEDAWQLRGHGDYDVSQSTLEDRIKQKARDLGCDVPGEDSEESTDCGCTPNNEDSNMGDNDPDFDIPDLSVDALAEKNDAISELKEERDSLRSDLDEMRTEIEDALDSAENFSVHLDEDECVCEAVEDLVEDLDEKAEQAEQVEDLQDELKEYREEEREEALDTLSDLGADADEFEDADLDSIEEEIERRKEVLEAADADVSVKGTDDEVEESTDEDDTDRTMKGTRTFGRGYAAGSN